MAYDLQAIIGKQQTLTQHASDFKHVKVVLLAQDIAMIPLTNNLYDEIADGVEVERFEKLTSGVEKWVQRISAIAPVAYIEAEFFGGTGGQSAVAWSGGYRVLGPLHSLDAINKTLRFLGVRTDGAYDEFEAVELYRHRFTDYWIVDEIR